MKITFFDEKTNNPIVLCLGSFDSIHKGHQKIFNVANEIKLKYNAKSAVFTYANDLGFIPGKKGGLVFTYEERLLRLQEFCVDEICVAKFTKDFANLSPEEFLNRLAQKYNLGKICCGFNYRFGKKAAGDTLFLGQWCKSQGVEFFECPEVVKNGQTVSSTYIKALIREGNAEEAKELLGEDFSFAAEVSHGDMRGRTLGFPTINQIYPEEIVKPLSGVYHTVVEIDGKQYDGVTNIGVRPTFITEYISAETYILNFSGDCYGKKVKTSLVKYLRQEKKFSSKEELALAIKENVEYVKNHSRT
jgi:riboflavin kinase/FMN adenylyltransferase